MRPIETTIAFLVGCFALGAAQPDPRIEIDPKTERAIGASETDPQVLKAKIEGHSGVIIVDVRDPAQFEKETLPGAINVPLEKLKEFLRGVPKNASLVFT